MCPVEGGARIIYRCCWSQRFGVGHIICNEIECIRGPWMGSVVRMIKIGKYSVLLDHGYEKSPVRIHGPTILKGKSNHSALPMDVEIHNVYP